MYLVAPILWQIPSEIFHKITRTLKGTVRPLGWSQLEAT